MNKKYLVALIPLLLTACGNSPKSVTQQYWQGLIAKDDKKVEALVSNKNSINLGRVIAPGPNSTVKVSETKIDGDRAQVQTQLTWVTQDNSTDLSFNTILVRNDDAWKVDTLRTRQQFFTAVYRTSLDGLSSVLAESLSSFQALGDQVADDMAKELNEAIDELQQQSDKANDDIQHLLESLDKNLQETIESINKEP